MVKSLGGVCFIHNGVELDYCTKETVKNLSALCDQVIVVDAGSTDNTYEDQIKTDDPKVSIVRVSTEEWLKHQGREKISFFQNLAMSFLTTDYYIVIQADEILTEVSFPAVRKAMELGGEGYFCRRINLWGDSQHYLDVPHERMPVSTEVIRLAKVGHPSVDDGESIDCPFPVRGFMEDIRIYHLGFIRDRHKHIEKIKHIQGEVFQMEVDPRIIAMGDTWNPWKMFSKDDVKPILEPLPKVIQEWAAERDENIKLISKNFGKPDF